MLASSNAESDLTVCHKNRQFPLYQNYLPILLGVHFLEDWMRERFGRQFAVNSDSDDHSSEFKVTNTIVQYLASNEAGLIE